MPPAWHPQTPDAKSKRPTPWIHDNRLGLLAVVSLALFFLNDRRILISRHGIREIGSGHLTRAVKQARKPARRLTQTECDTYITNG